MKIELAYPKIPESNTGLLTKCIAFEKYDGTNMHWVWNLQDGWTHFGTRRTQFELNRKGCHDFKWEHSELDDAPYIFNERLRDRLTAMLSQHPIYRLNKVYVFTEFFGPNSFAGNHSTTDAIDGTQQLILIDVSIGKRIIPPEQFIKDFEPYGIARVVYEGKHIGQLIDDVYKGKYDVNEGVVCKGELKGEVHMFKAKTREWLKRLEKR